VAGSSVVGRRSTWFLASFSPGGATAAAGLAPVGAGALASSFLPAQATAAALAAAAASTAKAVRRLRGVALIRSLKRATWSGSFHHSVTGSIVVRDMILPPLIQYPVASHVPSDAVPHHRRLPPV
jgi:hypothetical protein